MRDWIIFFLLVSVSFTTDAQSLSDEYQQSIRALQELVEGETEQIQMGELLESLARQPIDINRATREELSQIPFFDDFFVRNLLLYRSRNDGLSSIYDLKHVQGAPMSVLPLLEPFLTISRKATSKEYRRRSLFVGSEMQLSEGKGKSPSAPPSLLLRNESIGKIGYYIGLENDRGEPFRPITQGITDHIGLSVYGTRKLGTNNVSFVFGDFRVNTGQGLLLGQSFSYFSALSAGTGAPTLYTKSLKPHRSFRERGFLRGASVDLHTSGGLEIMLFGGYEPIDARIEGDRIKTLYFGTLHRTAAERKYRHSAQLQTIGGYIGYDVQNLHAGLSSISYRYRSGHQTLWPHKLYPQSKSIQQYAFDASYMSDKWQYFVEYVPGQRGRTALQGGGRYFDDHFGSLTLQGRYFDEKHITPYGAGDTKTSTHRNEQGIRLMWHGELAMWTTATLLVDHFKSISGSSSKSTILQGRVMYNDFRTTLQGYIRLYHKQTGDDRLSIRTTMHRKISEQIGLRVGAQLSSVSKSPLSYSLFSRIQYSGHDDLSAEIGTQYFNAAHGAFRANLPYMPYNYYNPSVRGKGLQVSGALKYSITPKVQMRACIVHSFYDPKATPAVTPNPSLLYLTLAMKW